MVQAQNRFLRKIEVAVQACRRKQLIKRESTRYLCCSGKGKQCGFGRKLGAKLGFAYVEKIGLLHFLTKLSVFSKTAFCPFKNNFLPKSPIP